VNDAQRETVTCPLDGQVLTLPVHEQREIDGGIAIALVVTDPGTVHRHIRDAHPERWAELCEFQRKWNASPVPGFHLPRKVDGTLLRTGEDVGDTP
jgi:hypothetical protein